MVEWVVRRQVSRGEVRDGVFYDAEPEPGAEVFVSLQRIVYNAEGERTHSEKHFFGRDEALRIADKIRLAALEGKPYCGDPDCDEARCRPSIEGKALGEPSHAH